MRREKTREAALLSPDAASRQNDEVNDDANHDVDDLDDVATDDESPAQGVEAELDEAELDEADLELGESPGRASAGRRGAMIRSSSGEPRHYENFDAVFAQWRATDDPQLREQLILMQRSLVLYLARRFMDRGELYEDVVQIGMVGLINALDAFDPARGVKFSTFAIPTISGEIRRFFRDKVAGVRVPRRLQELYSQVQGQIEVLTQKHGRSPTYSEIAQSLNIEVEEVVESLELGSAIEPTSLDEFMFDEESGTIADSLGALDPQLQAYEEYAALEAALERLDEKSRRVLAMAYFQGHSQAEIARRLGVSQMHISRLMRRALADLRQLLEEV